MQDAAQQETHLPWQVRRSIQEFRIDFLLEEEFACNIDFLRSFAARCGLGYELHLLPEVTHSSIHPGPTEIDLIVEFDAIQPTKDTVRCALLIEDKITAAPQLEQAERYKRIGDLGIGRRWDEFKTVLVAPRSYQGERDKFQAFVALEDIAKLLLPDDPIRSDFCCRKIAEAIEKKNRLGVKVPDPAMTKFKMRYYQYLCAFNERRGTDFFMEPMRNEHYSNDTWCEFRSQSLPRWCIFRHKIRTSAKARRGLVEIAFKDTNLALVESSFQPILDSEMRLLANGTHQQHVAIEIDVPEISGAPDFDSVAEKVEFAVSAAERLWRHCKDHWSSLETILLGARSKAGGV